MLVIGCALFQEEEVVYLTEAERLHAGQDEVRRRLGVPGFMQLLSTGEMLWSYRIWTNTGGDLNGPGTSYCDRYDLWFDRQATLRRWTRQDC